MIKNSHSSDEINRISYDILKQCKAWGKLPTPVDDIIKFAELKFNDNPYITDIPRNYVSKSADVLKKALRKINGILDRKEKIIYVDVNQLENRKRYVKLHEVGHEVLPWQKKYYEIIEDDEISISEQTKEDFESEANLFASATLFQLDRFVEEMNKLPLEIGSSMKLAEIFGASKHASLRRYVEYSRDRCALLVLKDLSVANMNCKKRDYFQSTKFTKSFGNINWNDDLGLEWPFVQDYLQRRRFHTDGFLILSLNGSGQHHFEYHFFNNTWNAFVFIIPHGEMKVTKSKIVYTTN